MDYKVGSLSAFNILDEEKRIVGGYIGDDGVDTDGHIIPKSVYQQALNEYLPWANIRAAHKNAVGKVIDYGKKGWNYIEVQIFDDETWNLVKNKVYQGFSIGAKVYAKSEIPFKSVPLEKFANVPAFVIKALQSIGKLLQIDNMLIAEISITDRPVNQAALFAKGEGSEEFNVLPSLLKDLVTTSNDSNLAPVNAAIVNKKKNRKAKRKMQEETKAVDKAMDNPVADPPVTEPVDDTAQDADMMDKVCQHFDASLTALFASVSEQINAAVQAMAGQFAVQLDATAQKIIAAIAADEAGEDAEDGTEDDGQDALTADTVKEIVTNAIKELMPAPMAERKATVNTTVTETVVAKASKSNIQDMLRTVAVQMAKASIPTVNK
jgi:hypothetical protein